MKQLTKAVNYMIFGKLRYISRFSMVGVMNTAVDFLMFTLCQSVFGIGYSVSQIIGYSFGVINSYILNKKFTFEDRKVSKKTFQELLQFVIVNAVSLCVTIIAMNVLIVSLNRGVYLSKILVTLLAQITNYLGYKLWVFNEE